MLVQYFVERKAKEMNLESIPQLDRSTLKRLQEYDWPGNVRELQSIIERALILSDGKHLAIPSLGTSDRPARQPSTAAPQDILTMNGAIADHIRLALERADGQIAGPGGAAELLAMNPSALRFKTKKLEIRLSRTQRKLA